MLKFLLNRLVSFVFLLVILSLLAVFLNSQRGGSALLTLSGQRLTLEQQNELEKQFRYEQDSWLAFTKTMKMAFTFDFGKSLRNQEVSALLWQSFEVTGKLALWAAFFALLYGLGLGVLSRYHARLEKFILRVNYSLLSVPVFIVGLFLIWLFALGLNLLPPGGSDTFGWFILPSLALGIKTGCRIAVFTHNFIKDEEEKTYVLTLRSLGFSRRRIFFVHILANASLPVLSIWLLEFSSFLAGAAIVETIFSLPGLGTLLLNALLRYDFNIMIGVLVFSALIIFAFGILQSSLDFFYQKRAIKI